MVKNHCSNQWFPTTVLRFKRSSVLLWKMIPFHFSLIALKIIIYLLQKKMPRKITKVTKSRVLLFVCFFNLVMSRVFFLFFFCYYVLAAAATVNLCISTLWPAVRTKCDAFPPVTPWSNPPTCTPRSGSGTGRTRSPSGTCTLWVVGSHTSVKVQQFTVFSSNFLPVSPAFDFPFLFVKSAEVSSVNSVSLEPLVMSEHRSLEFS